MKIVHPQSGTGVPPVRTGRRPVPLKAIFTADERVEMRLIKVARMMEREEHFRRNNELFRMFMHQVLDSPKFAQLIPDGADIVFLPEHDPELKAANLELVEQLEAEGKHVFVVKVTLVPETRTVFVPKLELVESA